MHIININQLRRSSSSSSSSFPSSSLHLTSPSLPHLGWLQVQDPGSSPSHCTQDDEDPHLEADTEESVRLAQRVEEGPGDVARYCTVGISGSCRKNMIGQTKEVHELEPVSPRLFQWAVRNLCTTTGVETRGKKILKNQKATLGALGFCTLYFFTCFSTLFFFIAKIPRFISKQKNQSCEKNLGQVHSGLFFCIFFVFFFRVFCCPKPNCPKTRGKQKKTKKKQSCEKNLG